MGKEVNMAVKYPTPDEVKQAFESALPPSQEFDAARWANLEYGVLDPRWVETSEGIETLEVRDATLLRLRWRFRIDTMNTRSETLMNHSAMEFGQRFRSVIGNRSIAYDAVKSEVDQDGPFTIVHCWTEGIIE
jgi:hypothetical protein